jgi:hypothetical protein
MAPKKGSETSGNDQPQRFGRLLCQRAGIGVWVILQLFHRSSARRSRELSLALGELFITRETVATDTPASLATSFIVAITLSIHPWVIAYIPQSCGKELGAASDGDRNL